MLQKTGRQHPRRGQKQAPAGDHQPAVGIVAPKQ